MAPKIKEEEKIEKTIRGLLKLPENRRCINCNSLGPQYVCTTFWTFVCTTCSGIHREFTHRVKSISMAKFTHEEAAALQSGGNERAKQIYLKEWDFQSHSLPDNSNLYKLRDFIKHVYVDRKYTGERSADKSLPRLRLTEKEESVDSRRLNAYRAGSRSPLYEDRYDAQSSGRYSPSTRSDDGVVRYYYDERRSPKYARDNARYGGFKRSPVHFEVVDDRFRDDGYGSGGGRRSVGGGRRSSEDFRLGSKSPDVMRSRNRTNYPEVRSIQELLGGNAPSLKVGETREVKDSPPAAKVPERREVKDSSSAAKNMKEVSSSGNKASGEGNTSDQKPVKSEKPTDSAAINKPAADNKPPDASAAAENKQAQMPSSTEGANSASVQSPKKEKPKSVNTLEALLFELSVPAPAQVPSAVMSEGPSSQDVQSTAPSFNTLMDDTMSIVPAGNVSEPAGLSSQSNVASANMLMDDPMSLVPAGNESEPAQPSNNDAQSTVPSTNSLMDDPVSSIPAGNLSESANPPVPPGQSVSAESSNEKAQGAPDRGADSVQQLTSPQKVQPSSSLMDNSSSLSMEQNDQMQSTSPLASNQDRPSPHSSQTLTAPVQENSSGAEGLQPQAEPKPNSRKELPADLFTSLYSPVPAAAQHWQSAYRGMHFAGQYYPNAAALPAYPNRTQSTNPFDLGDDSSQVQGAAFPSMAPLQGALPNVSGYPGLLHASSLGAQPSGLMLSQSLYNPSMPLPQSPSYGSASFQGAFMGQQGGSYSPSSGLQGQQAFGNDASPFGTYNTNQQMNINYSAPTTHGHPPAGGNPFG